MHEGALHTPWVIVAGGAHELGGMDKANAALARYLAERGTPVHLVVHHVSEELAAHPRVTVHRVPLPLKSFLLGGVFLNMYGKRVARLVTGENASTRVVVNGGNCAWFDINWVHYVQAAWSGHCGDAPVMIQVKNAIATLLARRQERRIIKQARVVIANSERTRQDLHEKLHLPMDRIHTVYLGSDASQQPSTGEERASARDWLGIPPDRPLIAFIGPIAHDRRKGFDTLWAAWRRLHEDHGWVAHLVVAGAVPDRQWRAEIERAGLTDRVHLLGFTPRVPEVLAASDLLVSPVRYEAYGLAIQEAICRGVPVIISAEAGVAERFPPDMRWRLLPDPDDVAALCERLLEWERNSDEWREGFALLGTQLRDHGWGEMARTFVQHAEGL